MSYGGGNDTSTVTSSIPPWLESYGQGYLQNAASVAQRPYTPYTGQRVADLSPTQNFAIQGIGDLASGTPSQHAADQMLTGTLQGQYRNPVAGQQVGSGGQYNPNQVGSQRNQYSGENNPHFNRVLQGGLGDIGRAYRETVAPDIASMFTMSGTYGGSAHQDTQERAQRALADRMGSFASGMLNDQYGRSAGLEESYLGRDFSGQQFNVGQGASAFENAAQRGLNAGQFNANLGSSAWENERNRQMQAVSGATGLASGAGQNLMNALSAGDVERRQGQSLLDSAYGDFTEWRNNPEQRLGVFGNALGSVMGRAGGTQTSTGPGSDPVGQGIGLMMLANAFGGKGGSGKSV